MNEPDLVLSLDLATSAGWALLFAEEEPDLHSSGVFFVGSATDRWGRFRVELSRLLRRNRGRIAGAAIERPALSGDRGRDYNAGRVLFGQLALAELTLSARGIAVCLIAPAQAKKALTGSGRASKKAMVEAAEVRWGSLSTPPGGETKTERARAEKARSDEADARAVGLASIMAHDLLALRRGVWEARRG